MNPELKGTLDDFLFTLEEVNILLSSAESCADDEIRYAAYNKSALLLLSGKFENFLELIAETYVYLVNKLCLKANCIPEEMKLYHSLNALNRVSDIKKPGKYNEIKKVLKELSPIWATDSEFSELKIECRFTYGKHGENELIKLFLPLGIDDIFAAVDVFVTDESVSDGGGRKKIDFKGVFNSVIGMRNNILHQNATPSLSHETVRGYEIIFQIFAEQLAIVLNTNLESLTTME